MSSRTPHTGVGGGTNLFSALLIISPMEIPDLIMIQPTRDPKAFELKIMSIQGNILIIQRAHSHMHMHTHKKFVTDHFLAIQQFYDCDSFYKVPWGL